MIPKQGCHSRGNSHLGLDPTFRAGARDFQSIIFASGISVHNGIHKTTYMYLSLSVCIAGADPGVGKGRGTNRLSVARWLEK